MDVKRTERGWAGHFICGDRCKFRRNTLLEYEDTKIVVSTVGAYPNPKSGEPEEIGYRRYYETMAFHAHQEGDYVEANVSRQVSFESMWAISEIETPGIDNLANQMHEAVVAELTEKLIAGTLEVED